MEKCILIVPTVELNKFVDANLERIMLSRDDVMCDEDARDIAVHEYCMGGDNAKS